MECPSCKTPVDGNQRFCPKCGTSLAGAASGNDTHVLRATMRDLEHRLDPVRFQRVHRSTIVNLARVKEMRPHLNGEYFLVLDSGHELKLSRS